MTTVSLTAIIQQLPTIDLVWFKHSRSSLPILFACALIVLSACSTAPSNPPPTATLAPAATLAPPAPLATVPPPVNPTATSPALPSATVLPSATATAIPITVNTPAAVANVMATAYALATSVASGNISQIDVPKTAVTPAKKPTEKITATPKPSVSTKPVNACAVLPEKFLTNTFGKSLDAPIAEPNTQFGGEECGYVFDSGLLFVTFTQGGQAKLNEILASAKKGGAPILPVTKLGDEAYVAVGPGPNPKMPGSAGIVILRKGDSVIHMLLLSDLLQPQVKDKLLVTARQLASMP